MKKNILFIIVVLSVLFASCKSQKTSYFQDLDNQLKEILVDLDPTVVDKEPIIKPKDELMIIVSSADPEAAKPFNLFYREGRLASAGDQTGVSSVEDRRMVTYLVDNQGYVNMPTLGKVKMGGLTVDQAIGHLEETLKKYLTSPIVNVQITNFKVSILGAVTGPGTFYFSNRQVSVLDVIASAKDLLPQARRDNILLIRTNDNQKEFVRFDLTKSDIITSPYFYLQQNDVIYVEPNKAIQQDANMNQRKQYNLTIITSVISAVVSTASLIIAVSKK